MYLCLGACNSSLLIKFVHYDTCDWNTAGRAVRNKGVARTVDRSARQLTTLVAQLTALVTQLIQTIGQGQVVPAAARCTPVSMKVELYWPSCHWDSWPSCRCDFWPSCRWYCWPSSRYFLAGWKPPLPVQGRYCQNFQFWLSLTHAIFSILCSLRWWVQTLIRHHRRLIPSILHRRLGGHPLSLCHRSYVDLLIIDLSC